MNIRMHLKLAEMAGRFQFKLASAKQTLTFWISHAWTNNHAQTPSPTQERKKVNALDAAETAKKEEKSGWFKWSWIVKDKIILSKIPSIDESENQLDEILKFIKGDNKDNPDVLFIRMVEAHEMGYTYIASPKLLHEKNIDQVFLPIEDFTANVEASSMAQAVLIMDQAVNEGKTVVVHCKAGRSRSATLVIEWLIKYFELTKNMTVEETEKWIKGQDRKQDDRENIREQVGLNADQIAKAKEVINLLNEWELNNSYPKPAPQLKLTNDFDTDLKNLLSSDALKNELSQSWYFWELMVEACKNDWIWDLRSNPSSKEVQDFCKEMYQANNADWYYDMRNRLNEDLSPSHSFGELVTNNKVANIVKKSASTLQSIGSSLFWTSNKTSHSSLNIEKTNLDPHKKPGELPRPDFRKQAYANFFENFDAHLANALGMELKTFNKEIANRILLKDNNRSVGEKRPSNAGWMTNSMG